MILPPSKTMSRGRIIARIRGGLGNQLFCYAAARRLALANAAELVIDDVTGFARDRLYNRQYMLDKFNISARKATPAERLEPFERYRRGLMKWLSRRKPFAQRRYIEQIGQDFDKRLLSVKVNGWLYLDGLWQSEDYFMDCEKVIREDLQIAIPPDDINKKMAANIENCEAVALHVRWYDTLDASKSNNVSDDYYNRAIELIEENVDSPHYFLFSDNLNAACAKLDIPEKRLTPVDHNQGEDNAHVDLWLMTRCKHFIIANSTFSWWGAWLSNHVNKTVVCPSQSTARAMWDFPGQIPAGWLKIQ